MKILYCNKYNFRFSGTEAYLFDVMELVRSHGHEVALFAMEDDRGDPTPYDQYFVKHIEFKNRATNIFTKAHHAAHAIYSKEARQKLRGLINQFRPDVAHVRNIYHQLSPAILWELRARKIPVLYHLNDFKMICPSYNMVSKGLPCEKCHGGRFWNVVKEGCYEGHNGAAWVLAAEAYTHKWLRTYQQCITCFLAPSQFVKEQLVENGWDPSCINVLRHFQKLPDELPANLNAHTPILYFGRLSPEKGIADLLHAMKRLPGIPLAIAGEGPQGEELKKLAAVLGTNNVTFVGHLHGTALEQLIAASMFTVMPSRAYETMGKSILESFACGRPVVASDLGSRRELIEEGKNGILFRPGDVDQLTKIISQLYADPNAAADMGRNAREYIRQNHSQTGHYSTLSEIYSRLAQRKTQLLTRKLLHVAFIGGRGLIAKYSGIETYYEEAGKNLAGLGHEITVYCRSHFTPPISDHYGMRVVRIPTIRSKHLETLVHTLLSTIHVMFSKSDLVHYHALGPALFSFIPRLVGKKTVVTVQGLDWQRKKWGWIASRILKLGEKAAVSFPHATIVVSHTLQQHYGSAPTVYIPNGTSIHLEASTSRLRQWGLEPHDYILYLGRFSPEKNCHLLIEAYEKVRPAAKMVLAGGSSYSDPYATELRNHQSDQIKILDWLSGEDFDQILSNALLFVLPSDMEGLSLALLNAMGAGVCVLTSDIPENRELVDGAGFTFKRDDVRDLERMLRLLLLSAGLRENAIKKARERIKDNYLWPQISKQIEQVYYETMNTAEAPKFRPSGDFEARNDRGKVA